jgi:hypothetical protein
MVYKLAEYGNPSIWEAEAGEQWVPGQPGLHSETLSHTTKGKRHKSPGFEPQYQNKTKQKKFYEFLSLINFSGSHFFSIKFSKV